MRKKVLVVDDEKLIRWSLKNKLSSWGYDVETTEDVKTTYQVLAKQLPDLVLLDIKLPDGNGIDILEKINSITDDIVVIMITAEGTVETAVKAMKLGAYDYISKPFDLGEMQILLEKAFEKIEMKRSLDYFQASNKANRSREHLIGESRPFLEVLQMVKKVASSPTATVLLLGESGTGKNVIARAIHDESNRADKPYITIECTTIPENLLESELFGHEKGAFTDARSVKKGMFELANGGTVFVDEVGDLPLILQGKLLRIIDEQHFRRVGGVVDLEIDVRIITATNMDLEDAVNKKQFRRDLFYRLNVIPIHLPPLRERGEDILLLAEHFMHEFSLQLNKDFSAISPDAQELLLQHDWPGNIRELRNVIERAVLLESGNTILREHIILKQRTNMSIPAPQEIAPLKNDLTLNEFEAAMIKQALKEAGGNQTKAADILGVSRDVLRYRMKKYKINTDVS